MFLRKLLKTRRSSLDLWVIPTLLCVVMLHAAFPVSGQTPFHWLATTYDGSDLYLEVEGQRKGVNENSAYRIYRYRNDQPELYAESDDMLGGPLQEPLYQTILPVVSSEGRTVGYTLRPQCTCIGSKRSHTDPTIWCAFRLQSSKFNRAR